MNRSAKMLVAVLCGALLWSSGGVGSTARASVLTKLSLADMTARAEHVFWGRVERLESKFVKGHDGVIITEVQIRCQRSIRGAKEGSLVTVRHLGGTVGELGQKVFGEASYQVGEEVVLLAELREGSLYAVGMAQGKLHIDRSTGSPRVQVDLRGADLVTPNGLDRSPTAQGIALDTLIGQLSELARRIPSPSERSKSGQTP
ncbi:MAG: hypothetical protein JNM40_23985 [Myxococcales bacterium]|nr:hypothetical protein [Myxococcales bacterium]